MFYIVESEKQLKRLESFENLGCYLDVLLSNDNFHPSLSDVVAVYVRPLYEGGHGFIIPINHPEGLNVDFEEVRGILKKFKKIFVLNKKTLLYHVPELSGPNVYDIGLLYSMTNYERLDVSSSVLTYNWFYNRHGGLEYLNRVIPISKLFEKCEGDYTSVTDIIQYPVPGGFQFYNVNAIRAYFLVEQSKLRVDVHEFEKQFKPRNIDFSVQGELVGNSYNLYNVTSRPTNSFNAVNFLAIPKDIQHRQVFKPQNDKFVELDFDGYHVRLVSELIGYDLRLDQKAHMQLAKCYFGKENISPEEYQKAKGINFSLIYGNIPEEYSQLEFTRKLREFIGKSWGDFTQTGRIVNCISGKEFTGKLKDMYPEKLMNYLIQSIETARNVEVLIRVLKYLSNKKTKLELVTYDSFLLDVSEEDDNVVEEIRQIMETNLKGERKYPVSVKESLNLYF